MTDRIYATYKPTIAPESYHIGINYERRDVDGKIIMHRIIDAPPPLDDDLRGFYRDDPVQPWFVQRQR